MWTRVEIDFQGLLDQMDTNLTKSVCYSMSFPFLHKKDAMYHEEGKHTPDCPMVQLGPFKQHQTPLVERIYRKPTIHFLPNNFHDAL